MSALGQTIKLQIHHRLLGSNTTSRSSPAQSTNRYNAVNRQREDIHSRKPILSLEFYVQANRSLVWGLRTTGHNPSFYEKHLRLQLLPPRTNTSSAAPTLRSTTKASTTSLRCPCRSAAASSHRSGRSSCMPVAPNAGWPRLHAGGGRRMQMYSVHECCC